MWDRIFGGKDGQDDKVRDPASSGSLVIDKQFSMTARLVNTGLPPTKKADAV